jgi:hypothetical protein
MTIPPAIGFAQSRFPPELEAPFLSFVQFATGVSRRFLALAYSPILHLTLCFPDIFQHTRPYRLTAGQEAEQKRQGPVIEPI